MRTSIVIAALCLAALAAAGTYVFHPGLFDAVLPKPGLGHIGGRRLTLEIDPKLDAAAAEAVAAESIPVLERRFDAMGWRGAKARREGRHLLLEVPDVNDVEIVCSTQGKLTFQFAVSKPSETDTTLEQVDGASKLAVEDAAIVTGEDIIDASASEDRQNDQPIVDFRFGAKGRDKFARATRMNVGRVFAIVLDGRIISAPRILTPIDGGTGQISGNFTTQSAREFATLLRAGALPAPVRIVANERVAPGR